VSAPDTYDLFEKNAMSYDCVNSIISLGLDGRWRRWAACQAARQHKARVLDAFSGTGLVGLEAALMGADVTLADVSPQMLSIAGERAEQKAALVDIKLVDLAEEPMIFKKEHFDAITMAFGVRYINNPGAIIARLSSLLRPGGKLIILEFVVPQGGLISKLASLYFFHILPRIGSFLAGQRELYDYLISSTIALGKKENLLNIISSAGLSVTETKLFGFGLVCGVVAVRKDMYDKNNSTF